MDDLTSIVVETFVPLSRVDPDFNATWAFIVTWFDVSGFDVFPRTVCTIKLGV